MYQYSGCGLEGIFLRNGYTMVKAPYGEAVRIEGVEALHAAIALDIVSQPSPMSGHQFRFLRKEQELTQAECASLLRVDIQTVANWEKRGKQEVPGPADFAIRMFYCGYAKVTVTAPAVRPGARPNESRSLEREHDNWVSHPAEAA
jgi:putative transcriptional regulator